jgi:hypothetical protein
MVRARRRAGADEADPGSIGRLHGLDHSCQRRSQPVLFRRRFGSEHAAHSPVLLRHVMKEDVE